MKEIFHRTSIRKYEKKKVEGDKIELLLRAAMAAPSAGNQQPWEFYVVTDRDKLKALSECSPYAGMLKEAPLGIVVCCQKDCRLPDYAQIDCSAAVENLLLEADLEAIAAAGYKTITPILICNTGDFKEVVPGEERMVSPGDSVLSIKL
mgnify:CR=1 FL=1